jgi:VanZ family protein
MQPVPNSPGEIKKKRIVFSTVFGVLLLFLYILIFLFSNQNGDTSSSLSYYISGQLAQFTRFIVGADWSATFLENLASYWENPIRKLAHVSEYCIMGILVFWMMLPWIIKRRKHIVITLIWVFISAGIDELHQFFVPGRYGHFGDVVLDTVGGGLGILLSLIVFRHFARHRNAKHTHA